jgi:hypothetical protein
MKHMKALGVLAGFFVLLQGTAVSGTVDNATLSPSSLTVQTGHSEATTFSATNDKAFNLKIYHAEFSYPVGLDITNIVPAPSATKAEVNSKKRLIILEWSNVGQDETMTAAIYVSGGIAGTYSIGPSKIYYKDTARNTYQGSCNSVTVTVEPDLTAPSPPGNVRSVSGEGSVNIYWGSSSEPDVEGYNIYRRTSAAGYSRINPTLINRYTTGYEDANVQHGMTYNYVVAALDASGNESDYSFETSETYYDLKVKTYDTSGVASAAVGDINGDGNPDIAFGYPDYCSGKGKNVVCSGKVDIFYGGNTTGKADMSLYGEGFKFGRELAVVDLNADGYDELIVAAPEYTPPDTYWYNKAGKIYIYSGGPQMNTAPVFTMVGKQSFGDNGNTLYWLAENLGFSIAPAGDINGDGYKDVLIGAPLGGMDRSGSVVLLLGGTDLQGLASRRFSGPKAWEEMGYSVSSAGDFDGDGYDDFIAGGPVRILRTQRVPRGSSMADRAEAGRLL